MIGDAIGGSAKLGLKGTCLGSKIIFGSKAIAALGGFGLSLGQIYNNSKALAERLNQNGWKWDDESKALAGSIGINAIFALFSAKNAGDNINGFTTSQCFVAGTLVLTIEGSKAIEKIEAGDLVYSTNPETGESEYKEVVQTFENETEELVHISVADDEIVTTPKHPFYVPHKGWTSAIDLRAGDILVLSNGEYVIVEKVQHEILENPVKVYNFEVQDFHTYYVGENSVLVHNKCGNDGETTQITTQEQPSDTNTTLPNTHFTSKKLQHEYKHSSDFGVEGNWNKNKEIEYQQAIQNHINSASNIYKSTYRGNDVYVYLNRETGIGTYVSLDGDYIGGWKFSDKQIQYHLNNGMKIK